MLQTKKINFEIESAEIIEEKEDSQFATARLRLFSSGENRHGMWCNEDVLKKTADSSYEKPVIFSLDSRFGDFGNHSDDNIPAGFIVPNSKEFVRLNDGRLSLEVIAKIWKFYSGKFLDVFKLKNKTESKLSVEMELTETQKRPDGLLEMLDFDYSAACILGEKITEASPSANISILSFSDIKQEYEKDYLKEFSDKYSEIDFTIPIPIKESAKSGLELYKKLNRGGNSVSLAIARHIVGSEKINPKKIRNISKHFKKSMENLDDKESVEYISCQLFGGIDGKQWADEIVEKMDEIDRKRISFFAEETMPYKKIEDINPSLKGIEPKITLEQANEIARQADAIGADKNGWPTAIKHFKDSHKIENGKWVKIKKEVKNSMDEEKDLKEKESMAVDEEKKETIEKEKEEKPEEQQEEEKEEPKKEEMSLDAYLDVAVAQKFLEEETENDEEFITEFSKEDKSQVNWAKVASKMFAIAQKMSLKSKEFCGKFAESEEKANAYMSENEKLKEFKTNIERGQFNFEVDTTIKDITNSVEIPNDVIDDIRKQSLNFSFDNVDAWKNLAKAKAFEFKAKFPGKKEEITRFALNPNINNSKQETGNGSPWKSQ